MLRSEVKPNKGTSRHWVWLVDTPSGRFGPRAFRTSVGSDIKADTSAHRDVTYRHHIL